MDLDISSLWSWTIPLWGLFVLVLFLGGVLKEPNTMTAFTTTTAAVAAATPVQAGGRRTRKLW